MAQAYVPIQTVTVGSGGASSIDFTSIPQTYTDLVVYVSARTSYSGIEDYIRFQFNGTTTNLSSRYLYGSGSGVSSASVSDNYSAIIGNTATANTFANSYFYLPNYTSSNYKSFSVDSVGETNGTTVYSTLLAGLWSSTSAVTSIKIVPFQSGNFQQYTTATLYGIGGARASGGTITADSKYTYHTFTSTGTFTANEKINNAEVLCIAGGGGGGYVAGGGGAGGVLSATGLSLVAGNSYSVTVGSGGATSGSTFGSNGGNSTFSSFTATGGGAGAGPGSGDYTGISGGSGGGAGGYASTSGGAATQSTSGTNYVGYGNAGGTSATSGAGGGGGAGGTSAATTTNYGGAGGAGTYLFSNWGYATSTGVLSAGYYYYAGGGGGRGFTSGGTGTNGGGNGGTAAGAATAGIANTGSGGGGGASGGTGGSGLVIIRYPN